MEPGARDGQPKPVFISRAGTDAEFAAVVGETLQAAGFTVVLQQWDFANHNFIERMHAALSDGSRVVALLSPEYLRSAHCQAEWQNAIADDPLNTRSRLILLRVAECEPVGLLSGLAYWDLVPVRDNRPLIEEIVRTAVREVRGATATSGPYWRAPRSIIDADAIRPIASFSGREDELGALSSSLLEGSQFVAICGLGGVGKSSLLREFTWRNRDSYSVIWWLNAQSEDSVIDGLLRLGALLVRGLDQISERRLAAQQVTGSALNGFSRTVLLIFDNLEDEHLMRVWLPRAGARGIATSRSAVWSPDVATVLLRTWSLESATDYLIEASGRTDMSPADARSIAESLGSLPLALGHAAAALRSLQMVTADRYLGRVKEHLKKAPRGADYPQSVFATFSTAIAQAEQQAAGAAAILCFAASFAAEEIPDELFRCALELYPEGLQPLVAEGAALDLRSVIADEFCLDEALGALHRLSLLDFARSTQSYTMHRLVQLAAHDLVRGSTGAWSSCAAVVADAAFPNQKDAAMWPQCERFLPHARAALEALPSDTALLPAASLAYKCADYLLLREEFSSAERFAVRALEIAERGHGVGHPAVARNLNLLGVVHYSQGRDAQAEQYYEQALAAREKARIDDDPEVAAFLNNLAALYQKRGQHSKVEHANRRALAIWERALGADHFRVSHSLNNLGVMYLEQGRYEEAEPLFVRALELREKSLGPDHLEVALSLRNIAEAHWLQGRFEEAEQSCLRSVAIREKVLGPDSSDLAVSLSLLARIYASRGRFGEAASLHQRELAIWEKTFGMAGQVAIAESLHNLADVYRHLGELMAAEPLLVRALAIREQELGADHALTSATRDALEDLRSATASTES